MLTLALSGKVAVVTGGGRGLGQAAAMALAQAGADVALLARSQPELEATAHAIESKGRKALALNVDVANEEAVDKAADDVMKRLGRIDILLNNAGIAPVRPLLESSIEEMRKVIDVNLLGTMICARAFGVHMVAQKSGTIVNVASVSGLAGENNVSAYSATKGGVIAFTRALAVEWARYGITVNAVAPGYFRTDLNREALDDANIGPKITAQIPLRRFGKPEELGPLIVYLASESARFMTGSIVVMDGGQTAH